MTLMQFRKVEPERDRWNRPLIIPPNGGKPVAYSRVTSWIDVLDDRYQLELWKQRTTAVGLALRPDLLLRVGSLGPQPDKTEDEGATYKKWRDEINKVCNQALEAGEGSAAATTGQALHAYTDRLDRGEQLNMRKVPGEYAKHLKAYQAATGHLTAVHIERFTVNDDLKVGGTPDRISMINGYGDQLFIVDTKSGDKLEWGMGKIAMQLAIYAHSQFYNPETGERATIPNINTQQGLVVALNAMRGTCELVWVDLEQAWSEAVQLAQRVRAWRNMGKKLSRPYHRDLVVEARNNLMEAIQSATSRDELKGLHGVAGSAWTETHAIAARQRWNEIGVTQLVAAAGNPD